MLPLALALAGAASADPGEDVAKACLETKLHEAYPEGWRSRLRTVTTLDVGQTHEMPVFLYGGYEVRFLSCAGPAAVNLDLLLVDDAGQIIARDGDRSREPELVVSAPSTGRYRLVTYLQAARSGAKGVPAAVALTFR